MLHPLHLPSPPTHTLYTCLLPIPTPSTLAFSPHPHPLHLASPHTHTLYTWLLPTPTPTPSTLGFSPHPHPLHLASPHTYTLYTWLLPTPTPTPSTLGFCPHWKPPTLSVYRYISFRLHLLWRLISKVCVDMCVPDSIRASRFYKVTVLVVTVHMFIVVIRASALCK